MEPQDDPDPQDPPTPTSGGLSESDRDDLENWIGGISTLIGAVLLAAAGDAVAGDTGAVIGIVLAFVLAALYIVFFAGFWRSDR